MKAKDYDSALDMACQLMFDNCQHSIRQLERIQRKVARALDKSQIAPKTAQRLALESAKDMEDIAFALLRTPNKGRKAAK